MSRTGRRRLALAMVSAGTLLFAGPAMAGTATFNVQTTVDGNQASPGTTSCASNAESASGKCTLRSSIEAANSEPVGTNVTINVPAGTYQLTVANQSSCNTSGRNAQVCQPLSSYSLNIFNGPSSVTVAGAGASSTIVDANFLDRAFDIAQGPIVTISGLTIEHGRPGDLGHATDCPSSPLPEADGGGILTFGVLTLSNDILTDNIASGGGGGLFDQDDGDTLNISGSTFSANEACQPQAQSLTFFRSGGAIDVAGAATTTIASSVITGNTADQNGNGGGIEFECCTNTRAKISTTTISDNSAFSGGGVSDDAGGVKEFYADTLSGNQASNNGGGFQDDNQGSDHFINTTVANNTANSDGGGLWETGHGSISFSTIAGNTSSGGVGNLSNGGEGGGSYDMDDSIVIRGGGSGNCNGSFGFTDNGYNLFDQPRNAGNNCGASAANHDIITTAPKVGLLINNGGSTKTEQLLTSSPAIDNASDALCQTEPVPPSLPVAGDGVSAPSDQRGIIRPQGPHCDIGAFEATPDLGVKGSVSQNPITEGDQDTVTWTVGNSNPSDAENATFTDPAAGYRIISVTPSQGHCSHTNTTVTCHLGLIAPGGHVTIRVVVKGLTPGTIKLNGKTATTGTDLRQHNNQATVRIRVKSKAKPPPPPPPPPPPTPARPTLGVNHLGAGCHTESSGFEVHTAAVAKAGIRSFVVTIGGHVAGSYRPASASAKRRSLVIHIRDAQYVPGRVYTVVVKVVDRRGRSVHVTRHFSICQPAPPNRGFTG